MGVADGQQTPTTVPIASPPNVPNQETRPQSTAKANASSNPQSPRQPSTSQRIGPYILGKTLGVGSTGRVKLGIHMETNQRVAIKIISKESLDPAIAKDTTKKNELNRKLEREITIMKLIQHPNVLQLYDVYETNKELFLVLEHVEGGELFDYLVKKGRLSETEAVGFFQQIILGVEFSHRHLICHRDLKPENLLLDKDRNVKIADFGMASMQVPSKMLETSCGSPHYASPEIIKGIRYDGATADTWSCGVILYALVTGNLPFDDENIRRLLNKVKTGMFYIPEHVGPEARDLIKKMLVVDPAKRITLKEVMLHPWFLSRPIKNDKYYPSPLETISLTKPLVGPLEADIIESLSLLGWSDKEVLSAALRSEEANPEKVFYNLLRNRKWEMFEHYDAEKLALYDVDGGPRRRQESYSSLNLTDRKAIEDGLKKQDEDASDGGGKSPRSVSSGASIPSTNVLPQVQPNASAQSPTCGRRIVSEHARPSRTLTTNVRVNSPLATSVTAGTAADKAGDASQEEPKEPTNKASEASQAAPGTGIEHAHRRAHSNTQITTSAAKKRPLTISIPGLQAGSGAISASTNASGSAPSPTTTDGHRNAVTSALAGISLGTPKFHRKNMLEATPQSPVISQTPKQSWFTNLFNFKPESFGLVSIKSHEETNNTILSILNSLDVKIQVRKDGLIRCKYDPNGTNGVSPQHSPASEKIPEDTSAAVGTSSSGAHECQSPTVGGKAVKFKIEMVNDVVGQRTLIRVQLTQQQGAFSTFQSIVERIQAKWTLDQ